jgi:hypothetical protein
MWERVRCERKQSVREYKLHASATWRSETLRVCEREQFVRECQLPRCNKNQRIQSVGKCFS